MPEVMPIPIMFIIIRLPKLKELLTALFLYLNYMLIFEEILQIIVH